MPRAMACMARCGANKGCVWERRIGLSSVVLRPTLVCVRSRLSPSCRVLQCVPVSSATPRSAYINVSALSFFRGTSNFRRCERILGSIHTLRWLHVCVPVGAVLFRAQCASSSCWLARRCCFITRSGALVDGVVPHCPHPRSRFVSTLSRPHAPPRRVAPHGSSSATTWWRVAPRRAWVSWPAACAMSRFRSTPWCGRAVAIFCTRQTRSR